jgi:hypothetical protein
MPRNDLERRKFPYSKKPLKNKYGTIHRTCFPEIDIDENKLCRYYSKLTRILKQFEPFGPEYDSS